MGSNGTAVESDGTLREAVEFSVGLLPWEAMEQPWEAVEQP